MSKTVCQNTLPFHSHRNITARFDASLPTQDGCCLDPGRIRPAAARDEPARAASHPQD